MCYNSSNTTEFNAPSLLDVSGTPFLLSRTRNVFTAIGCSMVAWLDAFSAAGELTYFTGCVSYCAGLHEAAGDGEPCTGLGCCQTSLPGNLSNILVKSVSGNGSYPDNPAWESCRCGYAFVSEKDWYNFSRKDLTGAGKDDFMIRTGLLSDETNVPMVLDWAIRSGGSCLLPTEDDGASGKPAASACVSAHSYCVNATQGPGYLCNCSEGYEGNPYIIDGCKNINECELRKTNSSLYEKKYHCGSSATCHDTEGNYTCTCNFGHRGDGKSEKGCQPIIPGYAVAIVATFTSVILACFALWEVRRRCKRQHFDKNGGELLKGVGITIFTERHLKKITNDYKIRIGKGAYGEVYKGTIGAKQVAVKRPVAKRPEIGKDEFVKAITFQFRITHTNIVCLVGCCLETDVPILVFEFVPNGSLYDVLHGTNRTRILSLPERLDIAIGSAEALSYMHSHAEHHVHGDVKSANILLDNDLKPKVSDFGSSKLLAMGMYSRSVAADISYLDPVYMKTGRFTEKSDVYSFSVVLLELITRKTAKYDGDKSLPIEFIKPWKRDGGNKRGMYDSDILSAGGAQSQQAQVYMECLDRIGELAVRCLTEDVEERPTMAEVLEELKQVKRLVDEAASM
ncbi:unnamed protein product [Urochloa decumbens]|uniref:Protein kinase domain-containing protein n=1 Tax=Urochloa decumbens TaxID=240449 RepID=A0ABC9B1M2_9POAL